MPTTFKLAIVVSDSYIIVSANLLIVVSHNHIVAAFSLANDIRRDRDAVGIAWLKVFNCISCVFNSNLIVVVIFGIPAPAIDSVKVNRANAISETRRVYNGICCIQHHQLADSHTIGSNLLVSSITFRCPMGGNCFGISRLPR